MKTITPLADVVVPQSLHCYSTQQAVIAMQEDVVQCRSGTYPVSSPDICDNGRTKTTSRVEAGPRVCHLQHVPFISSNYMQMLIQRAVYYRK